jgi:hypothetical protein
MAKSAIDALTEVQVTAASSSQSGFQLKFTLGKNSPISTILLPSGYFDPRRRVIIVVTIKGTPHVLMDGIITKQDIAPSNQAGQSTLTITGLDLSALMDFVDLTGIPYPALPRSARVLVMLAKYAVFGVIPMVIPTFVSLFENPVEKIPVQQGTDLAYINSLAASSGYVFYISPGPTRGISTAYWGPEIRHGSPQPALSINMDAATNVESLSFSYDSLQKQLLLVTILEKKLKVPIPIPIPDISPLKPSLAENKAKALKTLRLDQVAKYDPVRALLTAMGLTANSADAVTASGQLDVTRYGHVLKPRQIVAVRGAGLQYDGLYFVKNVTHSIKRGEFKQSFSLARGGTGSTISQVNK